MKQSVWPSLAILATVLLSFSCSKNETPPFDPSEAVVVSDMKDKMAHCSAFETEPDGRVFFTYYHDTTQTLEKPSMATISVVLAKSRMPDLKEIERMEVIRAGQTVGDYTQNPERAPYDPNLLTIGDWLYVYFNGCVEDGTVTYAVRRYDLNTEKFEDQVTPCTLSYDGKKVTLDSRNLFRMFEDMGLESTFYNDHTISAPFIRYKDAWYCAIGTAFPKRSYPIVVKTVNGIDFDVVMVCKEFLFGCSEASVEIVDGEVYVAMRNSGADRGVRGTYIAKYDAEGNCLVPPVYLSENQSKIILSNHKGKLFVFYNANPSLFTDWGVVSRSRLRISQIDRGCNIIRSWDITNPYGIHYPYVKETGGRLMMTFTEDRKMLDIAQTRSNISFTEVKLP